MCCTPYRATDNPRGVLEAKRAELEARIRDREPIEVERHADPLDNTWQLAAREVAAGTFTADTALLRLVEAAIKRIADGTFGACTSCGEPIAPARLRAVPWAGLCIGCQALAEEERAERAAECGGLTE
jgi:DnaK suppressor protein